eukprot:scaffold1959_cov164-Isochrysis_galbana.AAC.1
MGCNGHCSCWVEERWLLTTQPSLGAVVGCAHLARSMEHSSSGRTHCCKPTARPDAVQPLLPPAL